MNAFDPIKPEGFISEQQLKQIVPAIKAVNLQYAHLISKVVEGWTKQAACAFIAQLAHESASFNYVREIASGESYEGRIDLGNIHPGDGKKFKGRGLIQVTGRNNYRSCSIALFGDTRLIDNPELLEIPVNALASAVWFWNSRNLSEIMNQPNDWTKVFRGKTYNRFEWVTLRINGGQNGIMERKSFFERALNLL